MSFQRFTRLGHSSYDTSIMFPAARVTQKHREKPHGTSLALGGSMSTRNVEIANTILEQLGGSQALFLMGVNGRPMAIENGVQLKIGRNSKGANMLRVTLEADDTYTVRVSRSSLNRTTYEYRETAVREVSDVYAEQLMDTVEELTGLYLTLSARRAS